MSDLHLYKPLKLIAEDIDHLVHFSTYLQDGLFPITSMTFDPAKNSFSCLTNRFCWEMNEHFDHHENFFRVHSGLTFHHVTNVFKRNFHQKHPIRVLNLLMLSAEKSEDKYSIRMLFSGDIEIDLQASAIQCMMSDFQHPWPTKSRPMHWHEHVEEHAQQA
ncbi:MAG: DUF2948 family protein [Pseudomonadota bacterium]